MHCQAGQTIRKLVFSKYPPRPIKKKMHALICSFFERPFQSNIGSNLRSLLFEPSDVITIQAIETGIQKVLELNEPRIENINVIVGVSKDERQYDINVIFSIMASEDIQEVQINLKRVR